MADTQKQFDFPRAAKLRALERITCPGGANVKSLLKALDGFARDAATCTETLKRISVSMGVSTSTVKRARSAAQDLGLLTVYGCPTDGRSNTYEINWKEVFNLPDGISPKPRSKTETTQVNLNGDPGQVERGPRSICTGTQVKLNGALTTDRNDQLNATVRSEIRTDEGEGGLNSDTPNKNDLRPSGWWAWAITRSDLTSPVEVNRLFKSAVAAGVLENRRLDLVRFVALAFHTAGQESIRNLCGYLVTHCERGSWNYLSRESVQKALKLLAKDGVSLSPEQVEEIRKPRPVLIER